MHEWEKREGMTCLLNVFIKNLKELESFCITHPDYFCETIVPLCAQRGIRG
jgi:hypothetical protein